MITITIDIRHDELDKGTHIEYKPEFIGLVDKEEELLETKIYDFVKNLKEK
jgi:hypothetical protein